MQVLYTCHFLLVSPPSCVASEYSLALSSSLPVLLCFLTRCTNVASAWPPMHSLSIESVITSLLCLLSGEDWPAAGLGMRLMAEPIHAWQQQHFAVPPTARFALRDGNTIALTKETTCYCCGTHSEWQGCAWKKRMITHASDARHEGLPAGGIVPPYRLARPAATTRVDAALAGAGSSAQCAARSCTQDHPCRQLSCRQLSFQRLNSRSTCSL